MTPADVVDIAQKTPTEPLLAGLGWLSAIILTCLAFAKPLMGVYRDISKTRNEVAKDSAESTLYNQLAAQVTDNAVAIRTLQEERAAWFKQALDLEQEVLRLQTFEQMVNSMKKRLDEKDHLLRQRELEIQRLVEEITSLKDRVRELELQRVKECNICEGKV